MNPQIDMNNGVRYQEVAVAMITCTVVLEVELALPTKV